MTADIDATARIIRLEVREQLDARLSAEFDAKSAKLVEKYASENDKVRSTIRWIGAAFASALSIGALTVWYNILGIPQKVDEWVSNEIKKTVAASDVRNKYSVRIQQIYAESIAANIASKNPNSQPAEIVNRRTPIRFKSDKIEYPLLVADVLLLLNVLLDPSPDAPLGDDTFERVARVFCYANEEAAAVLKARVSESLQLWLFGNNAEKEKWGHVFEKPRRASALVEALGYFASEDADGSVPEKLRSFLGSEALPRQVRVTILHYLVLSTVEGDTGSRKAFAAAATSADPQVRDLGIVGLSLIDPADRMIKSFVVQLGSGWIAREQLYTVEAMSTSLCWAYRQGKSEGAALDRLSDLLEIVATKTLGWVRRGLRSDATAPEPDAERKKDDPLRVAVAKGKDTFVFTEIAHPMHPLCWGAISALFESALNHGDTKKLLTLVKGVRVRRFDSLFVPPTTIPEELPRVTLLEDRTIACAGRDVKVSEGTEITLNVAVRNGIEQLDARFFSQDTQARQETCFIKPKDQVRARLVFRRM